jgi:hypothetical protein
LKSVIVAVAFLISLTSPAFAQSDPIQQDLAGVLKALSEQITRADQLVGFGYERRPKKGRSRLSLKLPKPPPPWDNWPTGSKTKATL